MDRPTSPAPTARERYAAHIDTAERFLRRAAECDAEYDARAQYAHDHPQNHQSGADSKQHWYGTPKAKNLRAEAQRALERATAYATLANALKGGPEWGPFPYRHS